jgi:hypothetical protein
MEILWLEIILEDLKRSRRDPHYIREYTREDCSPMLFTEAAKETPKPK